MRPFDIPVLDKLARAEIMPTDAALSFGTTPKARETTPVDMPWYLVRHYNWAYLWPFSVWFFDHQPIINAILFGNYKKIMRQTMAYMEPAKAGRTLQVAAVYGELTPTLAEGIEDLHVIDVAPIQLREARRKLEAIGKTAHLARMKAEALHYEAQSFDTVLLFLLLHEMPPAERRAALREAVRVLKPGGRLVIAEYGECRRGHLFHRFAPMRWILTTAEPFLGAFWKENLQEVLAECGASLGRSVTREEQVDIFGGFYRVARYRAG